MDSDITLLHRGLPELGGRGPRVPAIAADRPTSAGPATLFETPAEAEHTRFHGSPGPLLKGGDGLAEPRSEVGASCRRYVTPDGYEGGPTLEQLWAVSADA